MSIEDKIAALQKSKAYHDENSDKIRFDANIPKTVVFPSDWNKHLEYLEKEFDDKNNLGQKKTVTYTIYKVYNPNSANAKTLRRIEASAALNDEISRFLSQALEEGYQGSCIAKITKVVKGNNTKWSVQGDKFDEGKILGEAAT